MIMRDLTREELNYSSNTAVVYEENQYTLPVLTNTHSLSLTFSSSNTNVATINSGGVVSIIGNGTTTISASFAGNDEYNEKTISYILIVDIRKYLDYKGLETFKQQLDIEFNKKANSSTVQGIIDDIGDNSTLNSVKGRIKVIEDKIPSAASSSNQLADKTFVNNSVATNTATYKGNYNVVSDLELSYNSTHLEIIQALALEISLADNNDYCFVLIPTSNSSPEEIKVIERYKFDGTNWSFEYFLNNSGFTSDLWKAINSGITSGLITTFNNKYDKPSGGIPKIDLSSTVQSSLDKADTALQLHQDISGKANTADLATVATSGDYADLNNTPTIPTKVSDLTNDSGFTTNVGTVTGARIGTNTINPDANGIITIPEGDSNVLSDWNETDTTDDAYIKNKPEVVTEERVLTLFEGGLDPTQNPKLVTTTNVELIVTQKGFAKSTDIPTKTSDLTNDSGFLTQHQDISGKANTADLATVATSGSYNDLDNKPTSLPASDVSAWAKAANKPSYSYSEINYNPTEITSAGGAISIDGTNPLLVITISAAVSGITFSAIPENGHSCHLIITAASALSVALAHGATMFTGYTSVCPEAADISLDITVGGYVELDLLRVGTKIYVRGV